MMQYERMGLMDAYLITRARRLNGGSKRPQRIGHD